MLPDITTIIFDMDGTLIDTEKYYRIFWPQALAHFGYQMTDEQALSMRSLGRPFAIEQLKQYFGPGLDYHAVREYRKTIMNQYLDQHGIQPKPGAKELLSWLREQGIQTAVATASDLERTESYLAGLGLLKYFDKLISATMVEKGKPAPDIYLYAIKQMNVSPKNCLAVEDSPNGVRSAHNAGIKVVMVPDQTPPDQELSSLLYAQCRSLTDMIPLLTGKEG